MSMKVEIGKRFRDSTALWNEWTVKRVYRDPLGHPHAVVANVLDSTERRTIACPVLLDPNRFVSVSADMSPSSPADDVAAVPALRA